MEPQQYRDTIKKIGKVYFALAVKWGRGEGLPGSEDSIPHTIADALRLMDTRRDGKKYRTKKAKREAAEQVLHTAQHVRRRRLMSPAVRKGFIPRERYIMPRGERSSILGSNHVATLPEGSLRERADNRIKSYLLYFLRRFAPSYSGSTHYVTSIGDFPDAGTSTERGEQYSKRCTFRKTDATHHIQVKKDYWHKVVRRGLVLLDNLLTLDLDLLEEKDSSGYTVYGAVWARVCGKRIIPEKGYIAVNENCQTAHASTPRGALAVLTRRANEERFRHLSRKIREKLETRRLNGYADIEVTLQDSYRAGNCRPGTKAFRDQHFPGRESARIEEVLSVNSQRALAINACLQAIKRSGHVAM